MHLPPTSTLFPYTTLFRSHMLRPGRTGMKSPSPLKKRGEPWRDRKSTRLNSSHVAISYAVFCLKKKTTTFTYMDIMRLLNDFNDIEIVVLLVWFVMDVSVV